MAHDAERGCSEDEQDSLLGDRGPLPPPGPVGRYRWVCGASAGLPAGPLDAPPTRPGAEPVDRLPPAEPVDAAVQLTDGEHRAEPSVTLPATARTGARPSGPAATDEQAGAARPGQPGESAVLASEAGGSEHASTDPGRLGDSTDPGRLGDRSRLVPRPRAGEPDCDDRGRSTGAASRPGEPDEVPGAPPEPASRRTPGCQTDLPGWAGAHRHGAVRPSRRSVRRDRPPRRWC